MNGPQIDIAEGNLLPISVVSMFDYCYVDYFQAFILA
jgi:hypothetical protein